MAYWLSQSASPPVMADPEDHKRGPTPISTADMVVPKGPDRELGSQQQAGATAGSFIIDYGALKQQLWKFLTLLRILRRELAVVSIAVIFIFELSEKYRTVVKGKWQ